MAAGGFRRRLPRGPWAWGVVAIACAAGLWLRFDSIGDESFWVDEVFSARIVEGPVAEIIDRIPQDKPPLDYYIQALFHKLGSPPEVWHRVPSAMATFAAAFGVYAFAAMWFGRRAALAAFVLAMFSMTTLRYSHEARPYGPFLCLTAWRLFVFSAWWREASRPIWRPGRVAAWTALSLALAAISIYTLYAVLVEFAMELLFLALAPRWPERRLGGAGGSAAGRAAALTLYRPLVIHAIVVGLALLAAFPLYSRARLHPPENYFWRFDPPTVETVLHYAAVPFLTGLPIKIEAVSGVVALGLMGLGFWRASCVSRRGALLLALMGPVPLFGTLLIYWWIDRQYVSRYTIFALPAACCLIALGVERAALLPRGQRARAAVMAAAIGLVACLGVAVERAERPLRPDYRGVAGHIAERCKPGDIILAPSFAEYFSLTYYLARFGHPEIPVVLPDEMNRRTEAGETIGPAWTVSMCVGQHGPKAGFYGLDVEKMGDPPDDSEAGRHAAALGSPPTLAIGACPTALLGGGWSQAESWGSDTGIRWGMRKETVAFLPLARGGAGRLTARMCPMDFPGAPPQSVALAVNGRELERRELPLGYFTEPAWDVPDDAMTAGFNRVVFRFAYVETPSKYKRNYGDFRTLAAAVDWVRWEPEGPEP